MNQQQQNKKHHLGLTKEEVRLDPTLALHPLRRLIHESPHLSLIALSLTPIPKVLTRDLRNPNRSARKRMELLRIPDKLIRIHAVVMHRDRVHATVRVRIFVVSLRAVGEEALEPGEPRGAGGDGGRDEFVAFFLERADVGVPEGDTGADGEVALRGHVHSIRERAIVRGSEYDGRRQGNGGDRQGSWSDPAWSKEESEKENALVHSHDAVTALVLVGLEGADLLGAPEHGAASDAALDTRGETKNEYHCSRGRR